MTDAYEGFQPKGRFRDTKDGRTLERSILVRATTEIEALAADAAPARGDVVDTGSELLYCNEVHASQVETSAGDSENKFLFEISATYASLDKSPTASKGRWTVTGQNDQVKRYAVDGAADHVDYPLESGSAPGDPNIYNGQGINVGESGAEGVEVDDPYEVLHIDMWLLPINTGDKLAVLRSLRNMVNDDDFSGPWGTYAAGECRLHGYTVSHVNGELDQVSIDFLVRNNVTFEATAQGETFDVDKEGHQYYWQRTKKLTDPADQTKNRVDILDAHVDTVYQPGDFSALGITYAMFDMGEPS